MKILVLGLNYAPEPVGIAVYTHGLCAGLAARGHSVRVVAGRPYYPQWKSTDGRGRWARYWEERDGVEVLRLPHFVPRRPTGMQRVWHHASFALAALGPLLWQALRWRPDLVLCVSPSLAGVPVALGAARLAGAPAWLHVQDIETDAAAATGLLPATSWVQRTARAVERWVLPRFARVSTISEAMRQRLSSKGIAPDRLSLLPNWSDAPVAAPAAVSLREQWGLAGKHVALYSGSLGAKHHAEVILQAARRLEHRSDVVVVICGEGAARAQLQRDAAGLRNVRLFDLQPVERLGELLELASVHLLPQRADVAELMLPSKLGNMLASGRPVVATAHPGTAVALAIAGCGVATAPGDGAAMASAIEAILVDDGWRQELGAAARARARQQWNREHIIDAAERDFVALAAAELVPVFS